MGHVIIDRRLNDKGKSSVNRQKFLNRVRDVIKQSAKHAIGQDINIADISKGSKKIKLPVRNLDEPMFNHIDTGIHHRIVTGNDRYIVGDKIPRPEDEDSQGTQGSDSGEGEDEFTFTLSAEEFLDIFFENCALPNLIRKNIATVNELENQRAGMRPEGSPSTLNIVHSMRQAKARKFGFQAAKRKKIKVLEQEKLDLGFERDSALDIEQQHNFEPGTSITFERYAEIQNRIVEIDHEIEVLKRKIAAIPFIDPIDLRYNAWEQREVPAVQAVMFCVMDVSGSMDQQKKELAKSFFMLLYLFLERNYQHVDIVFIKHHTIASEVDEQDFFYSKQTGGTIVSPAIDLTLEIIRERYSLDSWNVFVAQASDGDNWSSDNIVVRQMLEQQVLPIAQYYAYAQVNPPTSSWGSSHQDPNNMWSMFDSLANTHDNVGNSMITDTSDVYTAFRKLFEHKIVT